MNTTDLVKDWLSEQGFKHKIDEDGDLQFNYQGYPMWAMADENDPLFLRICLPGVHEIENDFAEVVAAINKVNMGIKVVKSFIVDKMVWITVETFVDTTPNVNDYIERLLDILVHSIHEFFSALQGNEE